MRRCSGPRMLTAAPAGARRRFESGTGPPQRRRRTAGQAAPAAAPKPPAPGGQGPRPAPAALPSGNARAPEPPVSARHRGPRQPQRHRSPRPHRCPGLHSHTGRLAPRPPRTASAGPGETATPCAHRALRPAPMPLSGRQDPHSQPPNPFPESAAPPVLRAQHRTGSGPHPPAPERRSSRDSLSR